MRSALLAAFMAFGISATPAIAASDTQAKLDKAADRLSDPIVQGAVAGAVGGMLDSVMDIRIDKIAEALEPLNRGRPIDLPGRTLGEMAEREDPYYRERVQDSARHAVGSMGAMAGALSAALPELERAMRRLEDALPRIR
jgi:energy-converting hydrogenase Eha subunit A